MTREAPGEKGARGPSGQTPRYPLQKGRITSMDLLKRNYDLVATASTGAVFLALDTTIGIPWWLWAAYAALVIVQIGNRVARGWAR
ncbi:hypothetical protein VC60_gp33 [Mycobacterium phage Sbash]|uniref:Uncharacterized protein n=1 Tax=Mycobacterium phage Sbash TaxID=1567475 RepID=A0A0A7RVN3_9CAUD|nr:hypothetical protein VC60_gp33 [Mycobacterium phage Sbash]AJA43334.1 hypothetical protein PBI_SBASH_33 [Mycobacterium phage Sbash]